jgi:hypothetical protein
VSERALIDVRIWVEADTEADVWRLVRCFQQRAALVAPEGVEARWSPLRSPHPLRRFEATMGPKRRRGRA